MTQVLSYFPGQQVTVFLETKTIDGYRMDSPTTPMVVRIIFPGLTLAANYPAAMDQIDTGLYYAQFTIPTGAEAVGSYLVDVSYTNPSTSITNTEIYQIVVTAPYGNFGTTTG